jgi:methionine sulfoxide reductase heme-binding subunit
MNVALLSNFFAFLSVLLYALTLLPGLINYINVEWRSSKFNHFLVKHRRNIGILAFIFGLLHGAVIAIVRQINFLDPLEYVKYLQGILLLSIFFVLAVTSNNFSVHHLKRNWKRLHQLTFVIMFLLVWHVVDKMYGHWTWFTPIVLAICFFLISIFTRRKLTEYLGGE